ncbi:MAG: alpha/beta hydrolase [Parvularcula sp.]|nr:alpha/beta hydrolase [Parvularcula sp.]
MTRDELIEHIERHPVEGSPEEMRAAFRGLSACAWEGMPAGQPLRLAGLDTALFGSASRGTILHFHGGGFVFGDLDTHRGLAHLLSELTGWRVVLAHLPPAPETPYRDQLSAALALFGELCSGPGHLVLSGDSAGGFAAIDVALARPGKAEALLTFSPNIARNYELTPSRFAHSEADAMASHEDDHALAAMAFGKIDPADPDQNLQLRDLSSLPRTFVSVGTDEVLLDDALLFCREAAHQGVSLRLETHPGFHLEELFAPIFTPGRRRLQRASAFLATSA